MTLQTLFIAALAMIPTFSFLGANNAQNANDNPSTELVLSLAEMLSGEEVDGGAQSSADNARLFLWDVQRPGVLSNCVFIRMDSAIESATLDRNTAVLFLADLVDGADSLTTCDAAAVTNAEAQLAGLGIDLSSPTLTTQGTFDPESLLSEAKGQRGRLKSAFERNNR